MLIKSLSPNPPTPKNNHKFKIHENDGHFFSHIVVEFFPFLFRNMIFIYFVELIIRN